METTLIYMFSTGFSIGGPGVADFIVFRLMDICQVAFYAAGAIRVRHGCASAGVFWIASLICVFAVFFAGAMVNETKRQIA